MAAIVIFSVLAWGSLSLLERSTGGNEIAADRLSHSVNTHAISEEKAEGTLELVHPVDARSLHLLAMQVIDKRCLSCHASKPTSNMFSVAPNGVVFDSEEQTLEQAERIYYRTVEVKTMPLANITKMTAAERDVISRWYQSLSAQ